MTASRFPALAPRLRFVLVRPAHAGNIGAAARAIATMGFSELAVVAPRQPDFATHSEGLAFASSAAGVLAATRAFASLDEALADCTLAIAVSAAGREFAAAPEEPEAAVSRALAALRAAPAARVALVFGTERTGLSIDEAQRCQALCSIPCGDTHGSLNVSQAVQVLAYAARREWLRALDETVPLPAAPAPRRGHATLAQVEGLHAHAERALVAAGFLDPASPKRLLPRLRRLFSRTRLEVEEIDILRGILAVLEKHARRR